MSRPNPFVEEIEKRMNDFYFSKELNDFYAAKRAYSEDDQKPRKRCDYLHAFELVDTDLKGAICSRKIT